MARAGQHRDMSIADKLPVCVSDCRPGDVVRERGDDREAGEGGGRVGRGLAPREEVDQVVPPFVLRPSRTGGIGALRVTLDLVDRAVMRLPVLRRMTSHLSSLALSLSVREEWVQLRA